MLASSLLLYSRYFFVAIGVTLPVGITVADEIGLAAKINGVSMRVRLPIQPINHCITMIRISSPPAQFQPSHKWQKEEMVAV